MRPNSGQPVRTSFTYISFKGTITKTACLILRDKERLENGHVNINVCLRNIRIGLRGHKKNMEYEPFNPE